MAGQYSRIEDAYWLSRISAIHITSSFLKESYFMHVQGSPICRVYGLCSLLNHKEITIIIVNSFEESYSNICRISPSIMGSTSG